MNVAQAVIIVGLVASSVLLVMNFARQRQILRNLDIHLDINHAAISPLTGPAAYDAVADHVELYMASMRGTAFRRALAAVDDLDGDNLEQRWDAWRDEYIAAKRGGSLGLPDPLVNRMTKKDTTDE